MARPKDPKPEEVLHVVRDRDREVRPLASTAWVSNQFPDVTRRTVYNRLDELADRDLVKQYDLVNTNAWALADEAIVPLGDGLGVCPECHGQLVRDEEYAVGFRCQSCTASFGEIFDGDSPTKFGRVQMRGARMVAWWASLPLPVRSTILTIVSALPERLRPNNPGDVEDRPENVVFDQKAPDVEERERDREAATEEEPA